MTFVGGLSARPGQIAQKECERYVKAYAWLEGERELASARDRFRHGVADNLDVVAAQANLARARSQLVNAQAAQQQARLNLAAATGHASGFGL